MKLFRNGETRLPTLCRVVQTQFDGGDSRKSGAAVGKPKEAV